MACLPYSTVECFRAIILGNAGLAVTGSAEEVFSREPGVCNEDLRCRVNRVGCSSYVFNGKPYVTW